MEWRRTIYERDDFTCQWCGAKGNLNADHIKSFGLILRENNITSYDEAIECKELWNLDNGRTLCVPCHVKTSSYGVSTDRYVANIGDMNA